MSCVRLWHFQVWTAILQFVHFLQPWNCTNCKLVSYLFWILTPLSSLKVHKPYIQGCLFFKGVHFLPRPGSIFFPIPFFVRFAHILTLSVALNSLIMHKKHNRSLKTLHKALNSCKKSKFLIFSSICASFLPPNGYEAYFLPSPPTTALLLSYTHPCCHNTQSPASIFLVF